MRHPLLASVALLAASPSAWGAIDLEFRPVVSVANVGDSVSLGLFAVSDSGVNQSLAAVEVIFAWDAASLGFIGVNGTGGAPLAVSSFMTAGSGGLNETNPPGDGDGLYFGFASFGVPVQATPGGTLLTTFTFQALAETPLTLVDILATGGAPVRPTVVYDGVLPNTPVTGVLSGASVTIVPAPGCAAAMLMFGVILRRGRSR